MTACNHCMCHKEAIIDKDAPTKDANKNTHKEDKEILNYDTDSGMNTTIESDDGDSTLIDCEITFVDDDDITFIEDYERKIVAGNNDRSENGRKDNGRSKNPREENGRKENGRSNNGRNVKGPSNECKSMDKPIDVDNMKDALLASLYSQVEFLKSQLTFLNNQLDEKDCIIRNLMIKARPIEAYRRAHPRHLSTASSATLDDDVFGECSSLEESDESNDKSTDKEGEDKNDEDRNELQKMFKDLYLQFEQQKNGAENDVEINIVYSMKDDENKNCARENDGARNNVDNDYDDCINDEDEEEFNRCHDDDLQNVVHGLHAQYERQKRNTRDAKYQHIQPRNSCKHYEAMRRDYENGMDAGKYTARNTKGDLKHNERESKCCSFYGLKLNDVPGRHLTSVDNNLAHRKHRFSGPY